MSLFQVSFTLDRPDVLRCDSCGRPCYGAIELEETRLERLCDPEQVQVEATFVSPCCKQRSTARQLVPIETVWEAIRFAMTCQSHANQLFPCMPRVIERPTPSRRENMPAGPISDEELTRARELLASTEFVVASPSWRAFLKASGGERLLWEDIEPEDRPEGWDQ